MIKSKEKAITLVALVITIVILLILEGISIQAITNTGLFANAKRAVEETKISKYGGFYVGRYEAGVSTLDEATGNIVEKANSIPYYHADYYTAVEMSERLYSNNLYVQSGLITGTQWDMMMKFLSDSSNYLDMKSSQWGNYDNVSLSNLRGYYTNVSTSNAPTDGFKKIESGYSTNSWVILTTGSTEQVLRKGLYDVAGNFWEWTQETVYIANLGYNISYNTYNLRGGSFHDTYASCPACYRGYHYAPHTSTDDGFRPVLYIK